MGGRSAARARCSLRLTALTLRSTATLSPLPFIYPGPHLSIWGAADGSQAKQRRISPPVADKFLHGSDKVLNSGRRWPSRPRSPEMLDKLFVRVRSWLHNDPTGVLGDPALPAPVRRASKTAGTTPT